MPVVVPAFEFSLPDPGAGVVAARVLSDAGSWELERDGGDWRLRREVPGVHRLEYLIELERADGTREALPDPGNPLRAPGAFGEKSFQAVDGYAPPWWLEAEHARGERRRLVVRSRALKRDIDIAVWGPARVRRPLPLLLVNDGPEYDVLSSLTTYAAAMIATDELRPFRVALLPPGERDEWYSASAAYARALVKEILPAVAARVRVEGAPVGMGASLGGLAMLHAHRRHPDVFAGLFLQSGSFFVPRHDAHESGFERFQRIVRFVRAATKAGPARRPVPVGVTCGVAEENIHNNRLIASALAAQGEDVHLAELGDTHNYVAWRDAFDPHLTDLLVRAWWS